MLQITGYRLPFQPAPVLCPLCTLPPGNPRSVQLQPCCLYPAELCPESPVQLPVNSLVAVRSPSYQPYSISAKPISAMPFSLRQFQSSPIENVTRAQDARGSGVDDVTSNNGGREESRQHRFAATAGNKKQRRKRTIFTCEQLNRLESEFEEQQYMVGTERQQLAEALNLSETQIKIWFQNRRIKWRKENKQNYPDFLASPFSVACAVRHSNEVEAWNDQGGMGAMSKRTTELHHIN